MAGKSKIEWTEATWNPVTGCSKVSPGCAHCYAETISRRFGHTSAPWTPDNAGENVRLHPERLDQPLRWRRPRRVFVNSMSDLFHELVPDSFIAKVFDVMSEASRHEFQILTKRPERMAEWFDWTGLHERLPPLPNVWLGVSVENQVWADQRIPFLVESPAAVRFLSCEPLLRPLDLTDYLEDVDWVIVGGESGARARPLDLAWVRDLVGQCAGAGVPIFVKQLGTAWHRAEGATDRKGVDWDEWPGDLRVREYPSI